MTRLLSIAAILVAGAAQAHPGHLAEAGGHTHWDMLAGLMVLGFAAAAIWAYARR